MKTKIKQVQQIVSLLKQNNIRHFVLSPGTRHVAFVHIVEMDPFFRCYSIVDERSAAFFALGLSEALDEPVGFACTSATASCNYMPAMKEAYERNIQLVALTSDKQRYQRFHGVSQVINQVDMFAPYCRYAVDLPEVNDSMDEWFCNRCINEALLEMDHHGRGPIQINFLEPSSIDELSIFYDGNMPVCRKINRIEDWSQINEWKNVLAAKKRILVVCGQYQEFTGCLRSSIRKFYEKYNCAVSFDAFSNVADKDFIQTMLLSITLNQKELLSLKPDLIITFGTKYFSDIVSRFAGMGIEHWEINFEGRIFDTSRSLTKIFEFTPEEFFDKVSYNITTNDKQYDKLWRALNESRDNSIDEFTNYYVAKKVLESLPEGSNVHASVLNSMKFTNMSKLPQNTIATGNNCADGIDGALSTFIGQAEVLDSLSLLVIGDLSYLYDLNAAIHDFKNNTRVLLINNFAGGEFHFNIGKKKISTLEQHIAAGHHTKIQDAIGLSNFQYIAVHNKGELEEKLSLFLRESENPILMEVFTNPELDGSSLKKLIRNNIKMTPERLIAGFVNKFLDCRTKYTIKKFLHR